MMRRCFVAACAGKPTALMRELVKAAPVGGTVLDPFAGSATTLVAAGLEGRNAIGFELSPEYWEISRKRIESTLPAAVQSRSHGSAGKPAC